MFVCLNLHKNYVNPVYMSRYVFFETKPLHAHHVQCTLYIIEKSYQVFVVLGVKTRYNNIMPHSMERKDVQRPTLLVPTSNIKASGLYFWAP